MTPTTAADIAAAAYRGALPDLIVEIYGGSDYAQLRADNDGLHLSFCGSNDSHDWQSNRAAVRVPYLAGTAHAGFLDGWAAIRQPTRDQISQFPAFPIHMYGHSRGGALAMIAAVGIDSWPEHTGSIASLTLFGSPRAGDVEFCRALERICPRITRYETRTAPVMGLRDAVPHLPPTAAGYAHPGQPTYLFAIGHPGDLHAMTTYRAALARKPR